MSRPPSPAPEIVPRGFIRLILLPYNIALATAHASTLMIRPKQRIALWYNSTVALVNVREHTTPVSLSFWFCGYYMYIAENLRSTLP